jgi:hypothetical protein
MGLCGGNLNAVHAIGKCVLRKCFAIGLLNKSNVTLVLVPFYTQ